MFDKRREHLFEVASPRHTKRTFPLQSRASQSFSTSNSFVPSSSPRPPLPRPTFSEEIYSNLLELESAFLRPKHWQSAYVKKMTYKLSLQASRKNHQLRESSNFDQQHSSTHYTSQHKQLQPDRIRPTYFTATDLDRQPLSKSKTLSKMISAEHQFSTIKTQYSEHRKAFVSEVNPMRPMLVQVEFEVFGELSGKFLSENKS